METDRNTVFYALVKCLDVVIELSGLKASDDTGKI